jgi:GWxTD domain-containing protein
MNLIINTPLAEAIGWTLVHSLWEGALIAAVLAATLAASRSPRARYAAACLALLLMLAGFFVTLIHVLPDHAPHLPPAATKAFPPWRVPADLQASRSPQNFLAAWIPWLTPLWLCGVWIFCLRHMAGWLSIGRLRRRGVCSAPPHWQNKLSRLHSRLRLSRPVLLLESCLADTPIVIGHFRPAILLPLGMLTGLPTNQIEAILLHELAHIRRCDYLVNLYQRLVEGLLFYHPAVWWISRVIRTERENCCDDAVVALCGDAHGYAVALTALEQNRWSGPEPAVAATGGNLMQRIHRLLYPKGPAAAWSSVAAIIILIATAAVATAAWQSEPSPQSTQQTERSPYAKWLNEDVVYIITDAERTAFLQLTSDAERQHFAEQFWDRRDPTPGTSQNEFKEEHYRRVAYANAHFQMHPGKWGWQTDRGHMYIMYGPPDEIDSHPAGDARTYPHEMWRYHHIEGIGDDLYVTFVDPNKTGDFTLAPGKLL